MIAGRRWNALTTTPDCVRGAYGQSAVTLTVCMRKGIVAKIETSAIGLALLGLCNVSSLQAQQHRPFGEISKSKVNFGTGCKAMKTERAGDDLIVTFDGAGNGITEDNATAARIPGKMVQLVSQVGHLKAVDHACNSAPAQLFHRCLIAYDQCQAPTAPRFNPLRRSLQRR